MRVATYDSHSQAQLAVESALAACCLVGTSAGSIVATYLATGGQYSQALLNDPDVQALARDPDYAKDYSDLRPGVWPCLTLLRCCTAA